MELKLTLDELMRLKRLGVPNDSICLKVEISESAMAFCKARIESDYKFEEELKKVILKIENDTLYKKL